MDFINDRVDRARLRGLSPQVRRGALPFLERLRDCRRGFLAQPVCRRWKWLWEQFPEPEAGFARWSVLLPIYGVDAAQYPAILYGCIAASVLSDEAYLRAVLFAQWFLRLLTDEDEVAFVRGLSVLGLDICAAESRFLSM